MNMFWIVLIVFLSPFVIGGGIFLLYYFSGGIPLTRIGKKLEKAIEEKRLAGKPLWSDSQGVNTFMGHGAYIAYHAPSHKLTIAVEAGRQLEMSFLQGELIRLKYGDKEYRGAEVKPFRKDALALLQFVQRSAGVEVEKPSSSATGYMNRLGREINKK